jgi:hypothetical protein
VFQRLLPDRPTRERCVEAYHLQRTQFERVAERKVRRLQLTDGGNVEITGRDLREKDRRPLLKRETSDHGTRQCNQSARSGIVGASLEFAILVLSGMNVSH